MAAAYRAGSTFGDGQTATTASLPVVIPASAQVGDVVVVDFHNTVDTTTIATPAGWTALDSQPNAAPSSNTSFLFAKELAAGEPGSTVTFTASSARRFAGTITVYSAATLTGYVLAKIADTATTTAPVLPTAAGVPAGAMIVAIYSRRVNVAGSAVGTITFPGYTAAVDESTAYTASPQAHVAALHKVAGAAGSYGGETGAASVTGFGTRYILALPATGGGTPGPAAAALGGTGTLTASPPASLPGLIDGVEPEAHGHVPPFADGNGNLYRVTEEYGATGGPVQVTDGTHNQPRMMKSTDGGMTWAEMDKANRPTDNDLESGWMIQAGTVLYYIWCDGSIVSFNSFNTSDAASNPDTWQITNERGITGLSSGSQQFASAVRLSDGRFRVSFSDTTAGNIAFITRAAAGGWSAKTSLGSGNSRGPVMVVGAANKVHEFHHDFAAKTVQYRTITSADVLSAAVRADTAGTSTDSRNYNAVSNPVYYDAAGTEVVTALYAAASGVRAIVVTGGVITDELVDSAAPLISPANITGNTGGDGPVMHLAAYGTTLYALFTEASTGDVVMRSRPHGGAWSARTVLWAAPTTRHASWVYSNVYSRAGAPRLGYTYDDGPHEDNDSNIYYNELVLAAPPLAAGFGGSGTLSAAPAMAVNRGAALSGSGSLAAAPTGMTASQVAALSGSGSLTTTQRVGFVKAAALSGSGALTTTQRVALSAAAALAGVGTLTTTQRAGFVKAAALSGSGLLLAEAFGFSNALLSGSGSLTTGNQRFTARQAAALSGSGSLAAALVQVAMIRAAALSGVGTLTLTTPTVPIGASLTGEGHLSTFTINLLRIGAVTPVTIRLGGILPKAIYLGSRLVWKP